MLGRLHLFLLRVYERLPRFARRRVVRTMSPSFTVGAMCFIERDDGALLLVSHDRRLLENVRLDQRWDVAAGRVVVRHT